MGRAEATLKAAQLLLDEGFLAEAMSRAYYAMLYAARAALASRELSAKTHRGTLQTFGQEFIESGDLPRDLGRSFASVLERREKADYSEAVDLFREEVEDVLTQARAFVQEVRAFLAEAES